MTLDALFDTKIINNYGKHFLNTQKESWHGAFESVISSLSSSHLTDNYTSQVCVYIPQ